MAEEGGVTEASHRAKVSATTVNNWRLKGYLTRAKPTPLGWLYDLDEVVLVKVWREEEARRPKVPPHVLRESRSRYTSEV